MATDTGRVPPLAPAGLRGNRNWWLLWSGQAVSITGVVVFMVNVVISPLLLAATPQELIGRVVAVIQPVQYLAAIVSMAAAGFLTSTVMRGLHAQLAGLTFGPYDTVYAVAGLIIIASGVASVALLRAPRRPPPGGAIDEGAA